MDNLERRPSGGAEGSAEHLPIVIEEDARTEERVEIVHAPEEETSSEEAAGDLTRELHYFKVKLSLSLSLSLSLCEIYSPNVSVIY